LEAKILITVLNWNGAADTIECVESLLKSKQDDNFTRDILIFDNHSKKEVVDKILLYLESFSKQKSIILEDEQSVLQMFYCNTVRIFLYISNENLGFSRACNRSVMFSNTMGYHYSILLNNDTVVQGDAIKLLWDGFISEKLDIAIPQIRFWNPKDMIWNCGGNVTKFGRVQYNHGGAYFKDVNLTKVIHVNFATGCCMLFSNEFFLGVGGFTENYFFGEEDVELSFRLKKLNKKCGCVTASIIHHKVGSSIKGDVNVLSRKAFIHYLNRFLNMKNNMPRVTWFIWRIIMLIGITKTLRRKYKLDFVPIFQFITALYSDSNIKTGVDKKFFESVMKKGVNLRNQ